MYLVEIEEKKIDKLSEHIEESLRHMGKAMQCVDEWMEEGSMKHHGGMGYRNEGGRYGGGRMGYRYPVMGGSGMGYRDDEGWDDDDMISERRGRKRDSRGRYY